MVPPLVRSPLSSASRAATTIVPLLSAAVLALAGCESPGGPSDQPPESPVDVATLRMELEPDTAGASDSFAAVVTIDNPTADTFRLETSVCRRLYSLHLQDAPDAVEAISLGPGLGCPAVPLEGQGELERWKLPPGEYVERRFMMLFNFEAYRWPAPGPYTFRASAEDPALREGSVVDTILLR